MRTLEVALGERSYPIYIGANLLSQSLLAKHTGNEVMLVSNDTVAPLYLDQVRNALTAERVAQVILKDGEQYKTLDAFKQILDQLLTDNHDRTTTLVAVGGGVVGDITGFAAACYQRGVKFVQVPTTLLAQVDSSVGGKTAVNHPQGKNMIGAFHQPQAVVIDTQVLKTLPRRELAAGMAEVIKYGLIRDAAFFDWLEAHLDKLFQGDEEALAYCIEKSCHNKADVVAADETEQGIRAILNLGHTFGHAIETHTGYSSWLHGEAVAAGMVMACRYSVELGWLADSVAARAEALLERCDLPTEPPNNMSASDFLSHMAHDKKVRDGKLRLVLMQQLGEAVVTAAHSGKELETFLHNHLSNSA